MVYKDGEIYPLFVPPEHLATSDSWKWSSAEAEKYKQWLLDVQGQRIGRLLHFLDEAPQERSPEEHLQAIGEKFGKLLQFDAFSKQGQLGQELTNRGMAMAADIGLLVANYLLEACKPAVYWEVLRGGRKRELGYNLPVLKGFRNTYLEPVGGAIAEATAFLRGDRGFEVWRKMFVFWRQQCLG